MLGDSHCVIQGDRPSIPGSTGDSSANVDGRAAPRHEAISSLLPSCTTAWILSDGKIGDEVQCYGIAEALGLKPERRLMW